MKNTQMNQAGVTLLEVIFVLVIMAVVALSGVNVLRSRADDFKVADTAKRMNLILSAGQNYYVDNKVWPISFANLAPLYISNDQLKDAWDQAFKAAPGNSPGALKFGVSATVPTVTIARNVASRLSNVSPNPPTTTTVTTYVPAPGAEEPKYMQLLYVNSVISQHPKTEFKYWHKPWLSYSCPYPGQPRYAQVAVRSAEHVSMGKDIACLLQRIIAYVDPATGLVSVLSKYRQAIWFDYCITQADHTYFGTALMIMWCCPPGGTCPTGATVF